jgi:starch synthase (maltosyl-transferring)
MSDVVAKAVEPAPDVKANSGSEPRKPHRLPPRIVIQYPAPEVDDGRFPAKRCVGDTVVVGADIFRDGHDLLRAVVRYRGPADTKWREAELSRVDAHLGGVRWAGRFEVGTTGRWEYAIEAWTDAFGTWRDELNRKLGAGQQGLDGELSEGAVLLQQAAEHAKAKSDRQLIAHALKTLRSDDIPAPAKHDVVLGPELFGVVERLQPRHHSATTDRPRRLEVDRVRARFGAWYEMFPRSWGGLKGIEKQLPQLAELGYDVVYLPPIHPIGHTNRKGRDNALRAAPTDPGSPWAIGDESGGHDAIHEELGTPEDLKRLTAAANRHGIDIALDFAIQASADHPWLREHPEWFHRRPDGTLRYAENPPKRYQDIYNLNWDTADWEGLWAALTEIVLQWVSCGVKVFRVDNPHTKPFAFWEYLIRHVHEQDRDVIFLAEAFTKRVVMRHLAKLGFTQSYTYFTWKNSRHELSEYVSELAQTEEREYFRANFFVNTPDILHAYLQHGGRPAFEARLVLAATLSPSYGVYSGFEHIERAAVQPGSEEYLHSEKYEVKQRSLDGAPLNPLIKRINHARAQNPALHHLDNVTFLDTANDALIAYAKQTDGNTVITVVNIDPHQAQEGLAIVPAHLNLPPTFVVHDLISDTEDRYQWRIGPNYVRLEPGTRQAHVNLVEA